MIESLPSTFTFLDEYQRNARDQVIADPPNHHLVQGLQPEAYMQRGLDEEINEMIIDLDQIEPGYSRFGALWLLEGNDKLQPGEVTATAVERHLKEFGDASWYLANFLDCFRIPFSSVVPVGMVAWNLDEMSNPRGGLELGLMIERDFPHLKLLEYASELQIASHSLLREVQGVLVRKHIDDRLGDEKRLVISAGKFTLAMIHVLASRFGISYKEVLETNKQKLERRMREGTVFDHAGGDDR